MDTSCDASMFRSMSVPLDTSQYQQNAGSATAGTTNVEDQIEQIRSILKPLYYAQVSDFDTTETRALTRRLVALSKLRSLGSDDLRSRFGDTFCAADLPGVFQHIWSIRDQLLSAHNGSADRTAHDKLDSNANSANSRPVLEDDTRPFSLVYKDLITCMWNVTDISSEMCRLVFERGCIDSFISDLRTPLFLEKGMNDDLKSAVGYATRGYFGILRNLVRGEPNCVARFVEAGGIEISVPYLDTPFQLLKMKVIMLLSDVVTDERDETRSAIIGSRSNLEYVAKVVLDAFSSGSEHDGFYSRKYAYCVDELLGAVAKLATSNDRNVQTFLETDLLDTLEQLLVRLRAVLLDCAAQTDTSSADRRKLLHTCCQVLHAAFSCLWAFAFNDSAKETILRRRTIVDVLRACTPQSSAPAQMRARTAPANNVHQLLNSKVHNEAAGALWQLQRCSSTHCLSEGRVAHEHSAAVEEPPAGSHIMITYQHGSQDLVRPLYEALTRVGLRVWIDYAEMHGSTVEAMALAVERAEVLLVCVSHAYKQSPSCRAEAMYAYRLKKPFIPIRVQASYVPDGWLGFICGSELLLELSKPTYLDGTLQRLVRIVWQRGFSQGLPFPAPTTPEPGQSLTRYVSSHVHTHSQPNSDAASYFTQFNTTLVSTDPPRIAVGSSLPSDPTSYQTEKSTSYAHAASMTMSPSPSLSCRTPAAAQHQFSAPPSTSPYSRGAQPTRSTQFTPVARQPMHIDHVFVPPESAPGTANGFAPAFGSSGGMYGVSRSTTQYGMSNATSSYSMADAVSSVTGQSSYAVSNNNNASGHVNANELTYDQVVGSPRDAKHADSAYSKRDSIELAKLAIHAESAEPVRRSSTFQNVDLCELVTWSSDNVADWLESHGVGQEFRTQLRELDGGLLFELAIMQKEAPQFLYEALRTDFQLPLIALLRVVRALRKLNSPSNLLNHY